MSILGKQPDRGERLLSAKEISCTFYEEHTPVSQILILS